MSALLARFSQLGRLLQDISKMVADGEFERADHHFSDVEEPARYRLDTLEAHALQTLERVTEMRRALAAMRFALGVGRADGFRSACESFRRLDQMIVDEAARDIAQPASGKPG